MCSPAAAWPTRCMTRRVVRAVTDSPSLRKTSALIGLLHHGRRQPPRSRAGHRRGGPDRVALSVVGADHACPTVDTCGPRSRRRAGSPAAAFERTILRATQFFEFARGSAIADTCGRRQHRAGCRRADPAGRPPPKSPGETDGDRRRGSGRRGRRTGGCSTFCPPNSSAPALAHRRDSRCGGHRSQLPAIRWAMSLRIPYFDRRRTLRPGR